MVKLANFDHLTTVILKFWLWSWSKIFDHLTMTPGHRPNGQKIMVILPPPPPKYSSPAGVKDGGGGQPEKRQSPPINSQN